MQPAWVSGFTAVPRVWPAAAMTAACQWRPSQMHCDSRLIETGQGRDQDTGTRLAAGAGVSPARCRPPRAP